MEEPFVSVVLLLFTSVPIISAVCPADFPYQYQCSCYQVVSFPQRSRWGAKTECEIQSAHLVFINSEEEKEALALWYPYGQTFFWIGLNGLEFEDKTWDDGTPASYTNFADHQLTFNDQVDCYRIVPYGWVDVHPDTWLDDICSDQNSYVCEYEDTGCSMEPAEAEQSGCPSGFDVLFECSCYNIRPSAWKTLDEARKNCESLSSHLVFIESAEETDFLIENYNSYFHYWIGLNGEETEIKTWDDGTEAIYSNFGAAELGAFNDYSGCYRIVPGEDGLDKWYDWDCEGTFGYICEYELCQTTTIGTTTPETTTKSLTSRQSTTTTQTTRITTKAGSTIYTTLETTELTTSSSFVSREDSTEGSRIDAGIFFGFYNLGIDIPSDHYLVQNVPDQTSLIGCASKCTEINCGAISYQYQTRTCRIAALIDTTAQPKHLTFARKFSCIHGDDFDICH